MTHDSTDLSLCPRLGRQSGWSHLLMVASLISACLTEPAAAMRLDEPAYLLDSQLSPVGRVPDVPDVPDVPARVFTSDQSYFDSAVNEWIDSLADNYPSKRNDRDWDEIWDDKSKHLGPVPGKIRYSVDENHKTPKGGPTVRYG